MKVREFKNKAENLIEQGENAKQRKIHYQQQANYARTQVMSAYARLEAVESETDEEGNPIGDVSSARAEVYAAQALLEAAEDRISEVNQQLESISRSKMDTVHEIEIYESIEEGNISKLAELQKKRFSSNANAFMADLLARMNSGEQARQQLLASMGIAAAAKTFSGGGVPGNTSTIASEENHSSVASGNKDSKSFLGRLLGEKKNSQRKIISKNFNGLTIENNGMAGDRYFVKGNNYDQFCHFWQNSDQYSHIEAKYMKTVNARDIEGIYLNDNEAQDPHLFWNRGQQYEVDSETYFMEAASHIPEVRSRLDAGESADSIRNDPRLEICYDFYFDTPINVYEVDGYYYFAGAGRHRCMAAQKLGYDIPVNVIAKYERNKSQSRQEFLSTYKRISSNHTIEDDLRKTNPNYSRTDYDSPWNSNCQRCVSAYEARRRGYDVEALPALQGEDYLTIMNHPDGWPSVYKGAVLINCSANSGTAAGQNVEETVKSWGDNCRGIVRVRWKPENGGGGHVFMAERINGITRFIDPQNGEVNAKSYFSFAKGSDVYCMRTDNLEFSSKITQCCKNREEDNIK